MDWFRDDPISTNFRTFKQWLSKGTFSFWIWKLMIMAHVAMGWYFVLMKEANMKLTHSGGQNRGIHRETKPGPNRASSLSLTNLWTFQLHKPIIPSYLASYTELGFATSNKGILLYTIYVSTSFMFPIIPINFLRPTPYLTYHCIYPRCLVYTRMCINVSADSIEAINSVFLK